MVTLPSPDSRHEGGSIHAKAAGLSDGRIGGPHIDTPPTLRYNIPMSAPHSVFELLARFNLHREMYSSGQYNETQLRREFVDPFFKILGWDVNNEKGYAEAYKDVIHEDSIN